MTKSPATLAVAALALSLAACTITQTATPISLSAASPTEICVIENPDVFDAFLPAMRESLIARGLRVRLISKDSPTNTCPLTATYVAYRSWDFKAYMSEARIHIYQSGSKAGEAIYDAPKGGWAMTTRIYESTESKVETMIAQLFPLLSRLTPFQEKQ